MIPVQSDLTASDIVTACYISETMGSVCSEIPELPELVEGVVAKSETVAEGEMVEVEMDGHKVRIMKCRYTSICHVICLIK